MRRVSGISNLFESAGISEFSLCYMQEGTVSQLAASPPARPPLPSMDPSSREAFLTSLAACRLTDRAAGEHGRQHALREGRRGL